MKFFIKIQDQQLGHELYDSIGSMNPKAFNKPRINSIDVLRGFALVGILLLHCLEHFESYNTPKLESPFWQWIDTAIHDTLFFLFQGKSFVIHPLHLLPLAGK